MNARFQRAMQVAAFFALLGVGSCNQSAPAEDAPVEIVDAWSTLAAEPYGNADLEFAKDTVSVVATDAGEGGVTLTLPEAGRSAVFFTYSGDAPANLRTANADGTFEYYSTTSASHIVLGGDGPQAALLYGPAGAAFSLQITGVSACDGDVACRNDGSIARRIQGEDGSVAMLVSAYGAARMEATSQSELLASTTGSGEFGITLSADAADEVNHLLQFSLEGPVRSLLVSGPGSSTYASTDQGWAALGPGQNALIYAAGPGTLHLKHLNLSACSKDDWRCAVDEQLAKEAASKAEGLDAAIALAEWAAQEADFGFSTKVSDKMVPGSLTAAQIHARYYRNDIAGGSSDATAVFLARLLRAKAFDAFSFKFGVPGASLTHATTIIHVDDQFYLLDATFGGYFAKPGTKEALDFFSVIDGAPFDLVEFDAADRKFIIDTVTYQQRLDRRIRGLRDCKPHSETQFLVCVNPEFGLAQYLLAFEGAQSGLALDKSMLRELVTRGAISIGEGEDTETLRLFAKGLQARGIAFHEPPPGIAGPQRLLDGK